MQTMTVPTTDLYVVEWSKSQNAIHIQPLDVTLRAARIRFGENKSAPNDYTIVYVGDQDGAHKTADMIRPTVHARDEAEAVRKRGITADL